MAREVAGNYVPAGYQQLDVSTTAVGLTIPVVNGVVARSCHVDVEADDVRWRDDGVDPSATVGKLLQQDNDLFFPTDLTKLRFIRVTTDAKVNVSYYI